MPVGLIMNAAARRKTKRLREPFVATTSLSPRQVEQALYAIQASSEAEAKAKVEAKAAKGALRRVVDTSDDQEHYYAYRRSPETYDMVVSYPYPPANVGRKILGVWIASIGIQSQGGGGSAVQVQLTHWVDVDGDIKHVEAFKSLLAQMAERLGGEFAA